MTLEPTTVSPWAGLGFEAEPSPVAQERIAAGVARIEALDQAAQEYQKHLVAINAALDQTLVVLRSIDFDGITLTLFAGAKGTEARRIRKQARIRVRRRAKAAVINAQPSRKGKSPWK